MVNNLSSLQEKRFEDLKIYRCFVFRVPPVVNVCPLFFAEANSNDGQCCDSHGLDAL